MILLMVLWIQSHIGITNTDEQNSNQNSNIKMDNKEICKIFNEAMSLLFDKTRVEGTKIHASHRKALKHASRVMKELTVQATIEKLLGYEKNDEGRIVKRVRTKAQLEESALVRRASEGDVNAADQLLKSWTQGL